MNAVVELAPGRALTGLLCVLALAGCAGVGTRLPASGPGAGTIEDAAGAARTDGRVAIIDIDVGSALRSRAGLRADSFAAVFDTPPAPSHRVGPGDVLVMDIWEAPPAALFAGGVFGRDSLRSTAGQTTLPEQMVDSDGTVRIPFVGAIAVAGRDVADIGREIERRLKGKANAPQVLVRIAHNNTANVTVVGEVASSTRVPLTPVGERLLDVLAAAGGVRQPVGRMTVQITRGGVVRAMPLDVVIQDPAQNVRLLPGDVLTALHAPLSLTVLGATGRNEELAFETQGISLSQALSRAGGLQDARADPRGVFVFRFEDPTRLGAAPAGAPRMPDGRVPVVYRLDLTNPASFFAAQEFPMRDGDVMYVSTASGAQLQKFVNLVAGILYPVLSVINAVP